MSLGAFDSSHGISAPLHMDSNVFCKGNLALVDVFSVKFREFHMALFLFCILFIKTFRHVNSLFWKQM